MKYILIMCLLLVGCESMEYYPEQGDFVSVTNESTKSILGFYKCNNKFVVVGVKLNGAYILDSVDCKVQIRSEMSRGSIEPYITSSEV